MTTSTSRSASAASAASRWPGRKSPKPNRSWSALVRSIGGGHSSGAGGGRRARLQRLHASRGDVTTERAAPPALAEPGAQTNLTSLAARDANRQVAGALLQGAVLLRGGHHPQREPAVPAQGPGLGGQLHLHLGRL